MKKLFNRRSNNARPTTSLRTRLLITYLIISLFAVLIIGSLSVNNIYQFSRREVERTSIGNLKAAGNTLIASIGELRLEGIRPVIEQASLRAITSYMNNGFAEYEDMLELKLHLNTTMKYSNIHSLFLINSDNTIISNRSSKSFSWELLSSFPWFDDWYSSPENYRWGSTYQLDGFNVIPYLRKIISNGKMIGLSVLNVYEWSLYETCRIYGNIVVLDRDNTVLSSVNKQTLGQNFFTAYGISPSSKDDAGSYIFSSGDEQFLAVYYAIPNSPFRMAEILSFDATQSVMKDMLSSTLVIVGICTVFCIALSVWMSSLITKPIKKIRATIDALDLGSLYSGMHAHSNDEIGLLIDSINNMTQRLNNSKLEILHISEERRLAEFRAIQLQINPHFLYNTLSSICWLTDQGQTESVKFVTNALSTLFRISVNHGDQMLRVQDEISHARCYLDIQTVRHAGEFTYQIDVDPDILDYFIIKILLQPLAENALYHGIRENSVKNGFLRIRGFRSGDDLVLEVIDNGDTPQTRIDHMNEILDNPDEVNDAGIGMLNVHNRIRYYYQKSYGLRYRKEGIYTIARIQIPIQEE
ncbi:MAG: histidine kinase [Clostridiaceae bacterium]